MKRTFLSALVALSLPAVALAAPSDKVNYDLFGKFNAAHTTKHNNANGDDSYARVGIEANTFVNDDLKVYGLVEAQYSTGKDEDNLFVRQGYVGATYADDYSLVYGRQDGVIKDVRGVTDILNQSGGDAILNGDNFWFNGLNDNILDFTVQNVLVDDLTFTAQYLAKDETGPLVNQHGEGYGFAVQYQYGVASFGAAYTSGARAESHVYEGAPKHAESWAVSTSLDLAPVTLAATYLETRNQTILNNTLIGKTEGFELVAVYDAGALKPTLAWNTANADEIAGLPKNNDGVKVLDYVSVGASYALADNISVSADYVINLLGKDSKYDALGVNSDDYVKVGVAYTF